MRHYSRARMSTLSSHLAPKTLDDVTDGIQPLRWLFKRNGQRPEPVKTTTTTDSTTHREHAAAVYRPMPPSSGLELNSYEPPILSQYEMPMSSFSPMAYPDPTKPPPVHPEPPSQRSESVPHVPDYQYYVDYYAAADRDKPENVYLHEVTNPMQPAAAQHETSTTANVDTVSAVMPPIRMKDIQPETPEHETFEYPPLLSPPPSTTASETAWPSAQSSSAPHVTSERVSREPFQENDAKFIPPKNLTFALEATKERIPTYVTTRATCSLNLVCYRLGATGCRLQQVHVAMPLRFSSQVAFEAARNANPDLLTTDEAFFDALRNAYLKKMCGFWRRVFFLKTLRGIRLLEYTPNTRPIVVPLDSFVLQEVMYTYNHPSKVQSDTSWIQWVYDLRQPNKRHALEFVEGWNGTRIAVLGTIPLVLSTLVGLIWSIRSGDWQTAFTVAGFILTAGTLLLALLAVVSGIEASGCAATV